MQVSPHTASWKETEETAFPSKTGNEKVCMPACDWANCQFKIMWTEVSLGYYMNPERSYTAQAEHYQISTLRSLCHSTYRGIAVTFWFKATYSTGLNVTKERVSSLHKHKEDPFMQCYCYIWKKYFPLYFIYKTNKQIKEKQQKQTPGQKRKLVFFHTKPRKAIWVPSSKALAERITDVQAMAYTLSCSHKSPWPC